MDSNVKNLVINGPADEITEYIDSSGSTPEERLTKKQLKVVGKKAYTLLKTLVYPKTLRDASVAEIQEAILRHVQPAQFELVEWAVSHTGLES